MAVHVVGGRVFGYRNVDVIIGQDARGRSLRSHVERVSDEAEAAVVVRIFELFAEGYGLKRIAKVLTADGAVAPKPFVGNDRFGLPPVGAWGSFDCARRVAPRRLSRRSRVEQNEEAR